MYNLSIADIKAHVAGITYDITRLRIAEASDIVPLTSQG